MLNSRLGLFTAALSGLHPNRAPLLPKLRGHFAEFLNESSLDHLRILSSPTWCRFAVRAPLTSLEAFLGSVESGTSLLHFARHHSSALWETDLPISQPNCLDADIQYRAYPYPPASPHCSNGEEVVQEYQPVVHRLRLSASA